MTQVGIIANPASGKDIRRLVSYATVVPNVEKADRVRRLILGLDSVGVDRIWIMPDWDGLGLRAMDGLAREALSSRVAFLDFPPQGNQEDSLRAARLLREKKADCIITLGGDGTNRIVSKGCGPIPLVPLSTGTNNVFPVMNEGTTAGMAAGILARGLVDRDKVVAASKKLRLLSGEEEIDTALIDAVLVSESFVGARAVWETEKIRMVFLTFAEPGSIGFSSLGAALRPVERTDPYGLVVVLGRGGERIRVPIAPGLIRDVEVEDCRIFQPGERVSLPLPSSVLALDGEREIEMPSSAPFRMTLDLDGPKVASIEKIMREAARIGLFRGPGERLQRAKV